jgi:hypothetical protein
MTIFPIAPVYDLLQQAGEACPAPEDIPDGWSKSPVDVMKLLTPFTSLRLKPGYVLRAYQFNGGIGTNGYIWAMPEDAPFPEPLECPTVEGWLNPHKPPAALNNLMDAIDGDGTPWSYLSASMLFREAGEFAAGWHGLRWHTHHVLGMDPWEEKKDYPEQMFPSGTLSDWTWNDLIPTQWEPSYEETESGVTIRFLTLDIQVQEAIYRFTDTFVPGSYRFETKEDVIGLGGGGIIF